MIPLQILIAFFATQNLLKNILFLTQDEQWLMAGVSKGVGALCVLKIGIKR